MSSTEKYEQQRFWKSDMKMIDLRPSELFLTIVERLEKAKEQLMNETGIPKEKLNEK